MSNDPVSISPPIILASTSPRRRELLARLGLPFTIIPADVDESPFPNEMPEALALRLALAKALAVREIVRSDDTRFVDLRNPNFTPDGQKDSGPIIIAADTVVALGSELLGKPGDAEEANAMIRSLIGREHVCLTGLVVARNNQIETAINRSQVWLRLLSDEEIRAYVASGDPLDKAGGYGIQNPAFRPVDRMIGCRCSIMGLPLGTVSTMLLRFGVSPVNVMPNACPQDAYSIEACETPILRLA